jgi:hypothetical protein
MKKSFFLSLSVCIIYSAVAMAAETPAAPAAAAAPTAPAVEKNEKLPSSSHPAMPADASPSAPDAPVKLAGKALQVMNGGGYTYVYIELADGNKKWVAVAETPVKVGSDVVFMEGMEMGAFESKALKRTFESIIFANGIVSGAEKAPLADPSKGQGVSTGSQSASKSAKISVEKATGPNAITVEGAFKNSAKLNKKKVEIRGQVVKVSTGIMNKNWIHIQDGTGSEKKKTHNLVCTSTSDIADVGDVVTISGTLIKDRDFGGGYKYAVIIEDAKVSK